MSAPEFESDQGYTPLPLRAHTILGVCEAIGEDFGFNPVLLRAPLAASVLVSPMLAIAGYFALGAAVWASRLLFPRPKDVLLETDGAQRAAANEQAELAKAA